MCEIHDRAHRQFKAGEPKAIHWIPCFPEGGGGAAASTPLTIHTTQRRHLSDAARRWRARCRVVPRILLRYLATARPDTASD
jgi:hypothetical protein